MKRKWLRMFAFAIVVLGACMFVPEAKDAKATTTGVPASNIAWGAIPEPHEDDVIFAGWYADADYKTPLKTKPAGDALCYAKWVDADILSIKMQASENKTKLRLVSSVDTLDYLNVGFEIYFTPEGQTERKTTFEAFTVLKRINAVNTGVTYAYSPKIISADSEYFVTATMTEIASKNLERDFYIRPYWTTCDGTKVYGVSRMFAINDCLDGGMINVTIKDDTSTVLKANDSVNVTLGTGTTETVTASVVGKRDDYVHLNVNKARTGLDSTTKVTYNEESTIYQNLLSKSTTDTSWYDADPDADKYVITTKADLMGIQAKVAEASNFANKEIYLVADMEDVGQWTPIDTMAGTFDGQGHMISGLLITSAANKGMFESITGKVGNFTLSDSTVVAAHNSGAIVAALNGELYNIYVDDTVVVKYHQKQNVGGIVGTVETNAIAKISNCSFAGTVQWLDSNSAPTAGGQAGIVATITNADCEIVNCVMSGSVEKGWNVGGLVGAVGEGCNVTLRNCLVTGTVSSIRSDYPYVDLLIGTNRSNLYVEDVYSAGTNKGLVDQNNTTIGSALIESKMDGIAYCWSSSNIYGLTEVITPADITGSNAWNKLNLDFYSKHNEDGVWVAIDGGVPKLKIAVTEKDTVIEDDYTGTTPRYGWYNLHTKKTSGRNTATQDIVPATGTVFQIETVGDLLGWNHVVRGDGLIKTPDTFSGDTVMLTDSVNLNPNWDASNKNAASVTWNAIGSSGSFVGTFDGGNHTISGVYVNSTYSYRGMFASLTGNTIVKNFTLSNSYMNCSGNSGAIVGRMQDTSQLQNVQVDNSVYVVGTWAVGGLVGDVSGATRAKITDCSFAGDVQLTGKDGNGGGILGAVRGQSTLTIQGCSFTGYVTGKNPLGGMVGRVRETSNLTIENSLSAGELRLTDTIGSGQVGQIIGLFHDNSKVTLTNVDSSSCLCYKADGSKRAVRIASRDGGEVIDKDVTEK
jgi:hypothetical protein